MNALAATLRGAVVIQGDSVCSRGSRGSFPGRRSGEGESTATRPLKSVEAVVVSDVVKILDGNTFVVSDDAGRHRGIPDRPDRSLLLRHALSLEVGADDRRPAAERAVGRRPALLGDALLPRPRDGHRVRRREGVGDPAARRRRRLSRGDHDPEPRREADRPRPSASTLARISPICSRSRTRSRRRAGIPRGSSLAGSCSGTSGDVQRARRRSRRRLRPSSTRAA